jgi:hypothetical protein
LSSPRWRPPALITWRRTQSTTTHSTRIAASIAASAGYRGRWHTGDRARRAQDCVRGSGGGTAARIFVRSWIRSTLGPIYRDDGRERTVLVPDGRYARLFSRAAACGGIDLAGNVPRSIATVTDPRGGAWDHNQRIVYSPHPDVPGCFRVPAEGGTPTE